jgi:long-chain acyl-CoA synthetase
MKELIGSRLLSPAWERWPAKPAVHDADYHADYGRHADRVFRLTDALRRQLGLERGDTFAVLGANSHQFLELYHAAFFGGGVITPLNLRLAPRELQLILADSEATVVFVDGLFAEHLQRAIADVRDELVLKKVVLIGDGDHPCDLHYEELIETGHPTSPRRPIQSCSCTPVGPPGFPRGRSSPSGRRCSTSTTWR